MADSKNDLKALIEQYSRDMMQQYSTSFTTPQKPLRQASAELSSQSESAPDDIRQYEDELIDVGHLQVRVSTENQAIPIPGAVITVTRTTDTQPELIRTIIADSNGQTPLLDLPTKDRRLSLEPNHPEPYAAYTVDVTANGYFAKRFVNVPIYGGVTAIQNVSMIPLPEQGDQTDILEYPQSGPQNL